MVEKSIAMDTEPVMATVTPNTERTDGTTIPSSFNPVIRELASEWQLLLADQYSALNGNWPALHSGDGLHLNDEGERVMAQTWCDALKQHDAFQDPRIPGALLPVVFLLLD
jgi:hypothetical protein